MVTEKDVQQIRSTAGAFAALLRSGDVVTWGHPALGGDSSEVQEQLQNLGGSLSRTFSGG